MESYHYIENKHLTSFSLSRNSPLEHYPGGMLMPGRSYSSTSYRFGYQGSLKDDEISGSGNNYNTFFRELDVRTLRWWGIDPKAKAGESPYAIMGCNPIWNNDVLGDSITTSFFQGGDKKSYSELAFKAFISTKEGYSYLSKFAAKGQSLYGVTFNEEGEYNKKGIDINYGDLPINNTAIINGSVYGEERGSFSNKIINGRLKLDIGLNYFFRDNFASEFNTDYESAIKSGNIQKMSNVMLLQRVTTLTHETFIHANYSVLDYLNIPYKKYSTLSYERDHYNEHMRTVNKEKTLFNTEGKQLLQHLNDSRNTGWDGNRIWNSMWDFQY